MIHVFYEDCDVLDDGQEKGAYKITQIIDNEGFNTGVLSFIFCSDDYLLELNRKHLNHDYYTDVLSFSYNEEKTVSGDIFISIDRLRENAKANGVVFNEELSRVMIHGVLHLCGYNDKSPEEIKLMRSKEAEYMKSLCFT